MSWEEILKLDHTSRQITVLCVCVCFIYGHFQHSRLYSFSVTATYSNCSRKNSFAQGGSR